MGNARSLKGGYPLLTPLKGRRRRQVYAMASSLAVSGAGAAPSGNRSPSITSAGRIPSGIPSRARRRASPVETAARSSSGSATPISAHEGGRCDQHRRRPGRRGPSTAGRSRYLRAGRSNQRVAFLGKLEDLDVTPAIRAAKGHHQLRTGSVVMNQKIALQNCRLPRQPHRHHHQRTAGQPAGRVRQTGGGLTNRGGVDIRSGRQHRASASRAAPTWPMWSKATSTQWAPTPQTRLYPQAMVADACAPNSEVIWRFRFSQIQRLDPNTLGGLRRLSRSS